jgi:alcohol dehydrogenase (cytochrome c)
MILNSHLSIFRYTIPSTRWLNSQREDDMAKRNHSVRDALLATSVLLVSAPAFAADVTPERLLNPDKEPQNWLMNHRTYDGQRFSPLARINRDNVKNLKLAYAVPLGGGAGNEYSVATPLAEDGFLYVTDSWGVLYKIDGTSGDFGRIVWRMDPKQDRQQRNRGAALWGNLVITGAGIAPRIVATNKETGKVVWETSFPDTPDVTFTSAALPIRDKIIIGAANGDQGVRDWIGALDAATGKLIWRKFTIPAPGEPGSETWKGNTNAWQTGGGAVWVTGTYDPDTNQTIWGTGNPVPMFDPFHRPGDNLYTNSAISWDPDTGKMNWYFQFTPGDMWDYDEAGTHIMIDGNVAGQARKLITHSARNGFLYTYERSNGQPLLAKPYMEANWTKGIDQKTGKPLDYDPTKDIQTYAGVGNLTPGEPLKKVCPSPSGGNNYWPSSYSPNTKLLYIPAVTACVSVSIDREKHNKERGWNGGLSRTDERYESNLTAVDPTTGEIKKNVHLQYPNYSGTLATAGGLVFLGLLDGTVAAFDDTSLGELWKINVGSGFSAPPMTFEVNGRQYVAIVSGPSTAAKNKLVNTPELKEQRNATVLYVFGL